MNMKQIALMNNFVKNSKFYLVKIDDTINGEIGKIIRREELIKLNLSMNEVYRSVDYKDDNVLFVYDLKSNISGNRKNPLSLLKANLEEARTIESMYPNIFTWVFDGLSIKAMAIVPSGVDKSHSTLSRYGGTHKFINILRQHLSNIGKMVRGVSPDYSFLKHDNDICEQELSVGSINKSTNLYSIFIDLKEDYMDIIKRSIRCDSLDCELNFLNMKFWAREINPDFVVDSKTSKLEKSLPLNKAYVMYPKAINTMMNLPYKGDKYRDIIARFLLSIHDPSDAKHVFYSIFGDEELAEVRKVGKNSWNYSINNHKKYGCPTNEEILEFIDKDYTLSHPLEEIQEYLDSVGDEDDGERT